MTNPYTSKPKAKKVKTAGIVGDIIKKIIGKSPGKKKDKKIDDILNQDPNRPQRKKA